MSGNNILGATSISPQVLVSQQLGTSEVAVYTVGASQSVKVAHGVLCNVTATMPAPTGLVVGTLASNGVTAPTLGTPSTATTGGSLAAGTYYYVATTTTAFGETVKSAEVSITTTGTTSTVSLSWSAITGSTGTKVYRGTAAGGENALIATLSGSATSYTDTGSAGNAATPPAAATSSTIYWKVSAKNTAGETLASSEVSATVAANQQAPLSWNAVAGAVSYNVYRGTSAGGENILVGNPSSASLTDTGTAGVSQSPVTAQTTAAAVTVFLSVIKTGGTVGDNTHRIISSYSLAASDSLSLRDYVDGAMLGPGDEIAAYASAAGSVDLVISGTVHA